MHPLGWAVLVGGPLLGTAAIVLATRGLGPAGALTGILVIGVVLLLTFWLVVRRSRPAD